MEGLKPRFKQQLKRLKIILTVAVILIALNIGLSVWLCYRVQPNMTEKVALAIESGDTLNTIARKLKNAKVISNIFLFKVYTYAVGKQTKFQVGDYFLEPPFSIATMIYELTVNPGKFQDRTIKVFEGWNNRQIADSLATQGWGTARAFLNLQNELKDEMNARYDFLAQRPDRADMEGYLFPDTYKVARTADFKQILIKMLDNFDAKLTPQMREDIKKSGHTLHEIVTMASVIEREVPLYEDRVIVSGLFWKRIDIGMGLQSDATVNYVNATRTTRPTLEDLKTDSLYNTYMYKGLPPGPICNPSIDAIEAALYPVKSDYLFFLSTATGKTIFSETYQKHLQAKYKYLD